MDFIYDLMGRFHPLIVHLPIGFLLLGLMMMVYDRKENKHQKIIRFAFFWGTFSTLAAILTGTIQFNREGYPWEDIQGHLILGVLTFVFSFFMYLRLKGYPFLKKVSYQFLGYGLVLILLITGHLGGNLTHGKDHHLSLYSGVIQPILDQKCVSCHNPKKSKGDLLLHNLKGIMGGGTEGPIISMTNPMESEILKRIHLPREEKKHMPPKAKIQLSKAEKKLIDQWVLRGAPQNKTIAELGLSTSYFTSFFPVDKTGIYPEPLLEPLDILMIDSLQSLGLQVSPIYKTSPLIKISAINAPDFKDKNAFVFLNILDHIVDLDLGQTKVTDSIFKVLRKLKNLTVLKLNHTAISGKGINKLNSLEHLKQINLVSSNFEDEYLEDMFSFPALEKVHLHGSPTSFSSTEIPEKFVNVFDKGNYKLD